MAESSDAVIGVFEAIRKARNEDGRPIVFLLGAGVSVGAGIPTVPGIKQYLTRVHAYTKLAKWPRTKDYLVAKGWPPRHQLAVDLLEEFRQDCLGQPEDQRKEPDYRGFLRQEFAELAVASITHDVQRLHYPVSLLLKGRTELASRAAQKHHTDFDYRAALSYLCQDDRYLVDAFFDRLVRDRSFDAAHQLVALLVRELNCPLILTTNFDDLVDMALVAEGRRATVFELLSDTTTLPHESLIQRRLSLVKLHGGTYSLTAGFDLESELPDETLNKLYSYLPPNPLLLVIGYSGRDVRVMSLVRHICVKGLCSYAPMSPAVIWIHREAMIDKSHLVSQANVYARRVADAKGFPRIDDAIKTARYCDGRLFLEELYQRLVGGHGVSRLGYSTLQHTPRRFKFVGIGNHEIVPTRPHPGVREGVPDIQRVPKVCLVSANNVGLGTSRALAKCVEELEGEYQPIWIDCAEIRSRATFVETLLEHLRRHDRWLPPVTLPPFLLELESLSPVGPKQSGQSLPEYESEARRACHAICYALRRGRYVVAVDSLGEFANEHPAGFLHERDKLKRFCKVAHFLSDLAKQAPFFGESILVISYARQNKKTEFLNRWQRAENGLVKRIPGPAMILAAKGSEDQEVEKKPKTSESKEGKPPNGTVEWSKIITAVACAFRRPRSLVAISSLVSELVLDWGRADAATGSNDAKLIVDGLGLSDSVKSCYRDVQGLIQSTPAIHEAVRQRVVDALDRRVAIGLETDPGQRPLHHQEGGYYWMRAHDRLARYEELSKESGEFFKRIKNSGEYDDWVRRGRSERMVFDPLAALHNRIASYYRSEAFEKTRDFHAFMEYCFHRIASVGKIEDMNSYDYDADNHRSPKLLRLKWLVRAMEREMSRLLATGPVSALLHQLHYTRMWLENWKAEAKKVLGKKEVGAGTAVEQERQNKFVEELTYEWSRLERLTRDAWDCVGVTNVSCRSLEVSVPLVLGRWKWKSVNDLDQILIELFRMTDRAGGEPWERKEVLYEDPKEVTNCTRWLEQIVEFVHARDGVFIVPIHAGRPSTDDSLAWRVLDRVSRIGEEMRNEVVRQGEDHSARLLEEVRQLRIRTTLLQLEFVLRRIDPWRHWDPMTEDGRSWLGVPKSQREAMEALFGLKASESLYDKVLALHHQGDELLRTARPSRRARRYRCYLCTVRGRAEALSGSFDRARVFFDRAKAALSRSMGPKETRALGVVCLAEAEMLLMHAKKPTVEANKAIRAMRRAEENSGEDRSVVSVGRKGKIVANPVHDPAVLCLRAKAALQDAYSALMEGQRDNCFWSTYYLLMAQLQYVEASAKLDPERISTSRFHGEHPEDAALRALHALRSARENLQENDERMRQVLNLHGIIRRTFVGEASAISEDLFTSLEIRAGWNQPPQDKSHSGNTDAAYKSPGREELEEKINKRGEIGLEKDLREGRGYGESGALATGAE